MVAQVVVEPGEATPAPRAARLLDRTGGTPASATLASVFCIGISGSAVLDAWADLPGPGAVALPSTFLTHN
jgi:hypothetical protein